MSLNNDKIDLIDEFQIFFDGRINLLLNESINQGYKKVKTFYNSLPPEIKKIFKDIIDESKEDDRKQSDISKSK